LVAGPVPATAALASALCAAYEGNDLMQLRLNICAASVVALAAVTGSLAPAFAGDWNNGAGSLKDPRGRSAVAVPAPMPIPDTGPGWYLRGSIGYSFKQTGDIISSGTNVGLYDSFTDLGGSPAVGVGFGAYINNNVRWDLTGDFRPTQRISRGGTNHYSAVTALPNSGTIVVLNTVTLNGVQVEQARSAQTSTFHTFDYARSEEARTANQTFLANVYYEPMGQSAFKPYIGAGAGFAVNTIKRSYSETGVCTGTETRWVDPWRTDGATGSMNEVMCTAPQRTSTGSGVTSETGFGIAGAMMAGVGYEVRDGVTLDLGYRYLWQAGSVAALSSAGPASGFNKIEIGDRTDHEVRTGLRWAIK
jgi:opacity protein-like surface antigen